MAPTTKSDTLQSPVPKRKRVWVPAASRGFELAVNDRSLSVKTRRAALARVKNPTKTFLARLVLDPNTPGLLRLEASEGLEKIQEDARARRGTPGRAQAEKTAKELLERLKRQQAEPTSEGTENEGEAGSVFEGLD